MKPAFHSLSVCAGCGCSGDDFGSVSVEAFEMTGDLYCEECADAIQDACAAEDEEPSDPTAPAAENTDPSLAIRGQDGLAYQHDKPSCPSPDPIDVGELDRLLNGATPRPWVHRQANVYLDKVEADWIGDAPVAHRKIICGRGSFYGGSADYALVCAAVNALPFLLSRSRQVDGLVEALRSMKVAFCDPMTRRALGGHNEAQQIATLKASAALTSTTGEQK